MSYRVYNTQKKKWLKRDEIFVSGFNEDLYTYKRGLFGTGKLEILSEDRYVLHKSIGVFDRDGEEVYEGDICCLSVDGESESEVRSGDWHVDCVVAYVPERAAFFLFDDEAGAYYQFNEYANSRIEVVGNVFDGMFESERSETER